MAIEFCMEFLVGQKKRKIKKLKGKYRWKVKRV